jgi:hypothetical protein
MWGKVINPGGRAASLPDDSFSLDIGLWQHFLTKGFCLCQFGPYLFRVDGSPQCRGNNIARRTLHGKMGNTLEFEMNSGPRYAM